MGRKRRYTVATLVWFALVFGAGVGVLAGVTEPVVSTADLPEGELSVFVGMIVLAIAGGMVTSYLARRAWRSAGREAGLTPSGGGLLGGRAEFSGTVGGRPVEVWIHEHSTGHGETKETHEYVVVEAELTRPLEEGVLVTRTVEDETSPTANVDSEPTGSDDAPLQVVGPGADRYAEAILSGARRNALGDLDPFGSFTVGDATGSDGDAAPGGPLAMAGLPGSDAADERAGPSNPSTVSHVIEGTFYDPAVFERQVEAVVAVADAVADA